MSRPCKHCGQNFEGPLQKRYCGTGCVNAASLIRASVRNGPKECKICGESYIPRHPTTKTCSPKCRSEAISRGKAGNKNPKWNCDKPDRTLWDASLKPRCEICGRDRQLRNHHIIYRQHVRKRGGDEWDPRNAMTLCMSCHSRHHSGTDFRIAVCDLPNRFFAFGNELLGDYLWDYLERHYDTGNVGLKGLVANV